MLDTARPPREARRNLGVPAPERRRKQPDGGPWRRPAQPERMPQTSRTRRRSRPLGSRQRLRTLSEWLSEVAWAEAIERAAKVSAEQDRRLPDELVGWDDDGAARVFGQDAA